MTRPRAQRAAAAAALALAGTLLAGCGGQSPYCETVEKNVDNLNTFGKTRTNEAYGSYAKSFRAVAKVAPKTVQDDWNTLAKVTDDILAAQKKVGLSLEDMSDKKKLADLDDAKLETLNTAYEAFNDTADQRTAVVKNVKTECEITLK